MRLIISLLIIILTNSSYSFSELIDQRNQTPFIINSEINIEDIPANSLLTFPCYVDYDKYCRTYSQRMHCNKNKTVCYCEIEYATVPNYDTTLNYCNYEKKYQLTAFLVEFLAGFGGGHFYARRYLFGSLKLVAFLFSIFLICLFPLFAIGCSKCLENDWPSLIVSLIFFFCAIGMVFWFIFDLVMFGKNNYLDGYNEPLLEW